MNTKIEVFNVTNMFTENQCYLIYKGNVGILIDPAWEYDLINSFAIQNAIDIKAVLLTHSHKDHTNLAGKFSQEYNVPVFMSGEESDHYNFKMENLKRISNLEIIEINNFMVKCLLTPGHTVGSTCYLIECNLFSGDTLFIEGVGSCSSDNTEKLYNSIQFLKSHLPENTLVWPGHSYGISAGKSLKYIRKNNIYFQFDKKQHFIDFRNRSSKKKTDFNV